MIRRIPPLGPNKGLRGGDRGGAHDRPLYANVRPDDSVNIGNVNPDEWDRTEYTDKNGVRMMRVTRRT